MRYSEILNSSILFLAPRSAELLLELENLQVIAFFLYVVKKLLIGIRAGFVLYVEKNRFQVFDNHELYRFRPTQANWDGRRDGLRFGRGFARAEALEPRLHAHTLNLCER